MMREAGADDEHNADDAGAVAVADGTASCTPTVVGLRAGVVAQPVFRSCSL